MTDKTLAEMTESELRDIVKEALKQEKSPASRARIKVGGIVVEFEGTEEFVSKSVRRHLASLSPSAPDEKHELDKNKPGAVEPARA
jgi:hypothetical protein